MRAGIVRVRRTGWARGCGLQITLPKVVAQVLSIKAGDLLEVLYFKGTEQIIVIQKEEEDFGKPLSHRVEDLELREG